MTKLVALLQEEHRKIEALLTVLERELDEFDRAGRPDYEVVQAVIAYFQEYPDRIHHPKEDAIFVKLRVRDPGAAARIGDLEAEHRGGSGRLERVAEAVKGVLNEEEILREAVDGIVREFIEGERRHMAMEERIFVPAAIKALSSGDWAEIEANVGPQQRMPSEKAVQAKLDALRGEILRLEQQAEAERA